MDKQTNKGRVSLFVCVLDGVWRCTVHF